VIISQSVLGGLHHRYARKSPRTRFDKGQWQNGYAGRVIGSIRRECLDHIIPINAEHLRSALQEYVKYYNDDRTHLALGKDSPHSQPVETQGTIVSRRILGGLHHRYRRI
jgi:hypothetical protein